MPFANYKDFDACVRANQGKVKNPAAYCAAIKKKVEGETKHGNEFSSMEECMKAHAGNPNAKNICSMKMKGKMMSQSIDTPVKISFVAGIKEFAQTPTTEGFASFTVGGTAIDECTSRNGIKYKAKELERAAPTLVHKPILKDHKNEVDSVVGKVTESKYDPIKKSIEYKGNIVDEKAKMLIAQGMINHVSIGATVRNMREETIDENKELIAEGIEILELSLTPVPGIPNASIQGQSFAEAIQEAYNSSFAINKTVQINEVNDNMENNAEIDVLKEQLKKLEEEKQAMETKMVLERKSVIVEAILKTNNALNKEDLLKKEFAELELIKKYEEALIVKNADVQKARVEQQAPTQENNVVRITSDDDMRVSEAKAGDLVIGPDNFYIMPNYQKQRQKKF